MHPEFAQFSDVFLELVESIGRHPHFGINFDPSNAVVAGEDPIELLQQVVDQVPKFRLIGGLSVQEVPPLRFREF